MPFFTANTKEKAILMHSCKVVSVALFALLTVSTIRAQSPSPSATPTETPSTTEREYRDLSGYIPAYFGYGLRTEQETHLGWGVLGFGALIIGLEIFVMIRMNK